MRCVYSLSESRLKIAQHIQYSCSLLHITTGPTLESYTPVSSHYWVAVECSHNQSKHSLLLSSHENVFNSSTLPLKISFQTESCRMIHEFIEMIYDAWMKPQIRLWASPSWWSNQFDFEWSEIWYCLKHSHPLAIPFLVKSQLSHPLKVMSSKRTISFVDLKPIESLLSIPAKVSY